MKNTVHVLTMAVWILALVLSIASYTHSSSIASEQCKLWQVRSNGRCVDGNDLHGRVKFPNVNEILLKNSLCMTWNNDTDSAQVSYCLFIPCKKTRVSHDNPGYYAIPTNLTGRTLNAKTCEDFNREGLQCRKCISGYGPAVFYDGITCADCSKNRFMWILNLLFQLGGVAVTYLGVILLQMKGTSCPLNITITYSQLTVNILMISSRLHNKLVCRFGKRFAMFLLTVFGVFNLDYFRYLLPPLCLNTSASPMDILLFDYVIALSPIVFTAVCYVGIVIHDRNCHNRLVVFLSFPIKRCLRRYKNWNPKETILNAFATLLLCGYTKLIFVSVNLVAGIRSYNSHGEVVPNSTVLLYDPTIRFFNSDHIPYIVIALTIVLLLVVLPPMLLLLYPTKAFTKCLERCGFQNWDILHVIMDIFQGWYKDGTNGTHDYRPLSAFYMLLRISVGCAFVIIIYNASEGFRVDYIFGTLHVLFGTFFFVANPYKKKWMNYADGFLLSFSGVILLMTDYHGRVYILVIILGSSVLSVVYSYTFYKCFRLFW